MPFSKSFAKILIFLYSTRAVNDNFWNFIGNYISHLLIHLKSIYLTFKKIKSLYSYYQFTKPYILEFLTFYPLIQKIYKLIIANWNRCLIRFVTIILSQWICHQLQPNLLKSVHSLHNFMYAPLFHIFPLQYKSVPLHSKNICTRCTRFVKIQSETKKGM